MSNSQALLLAASLLVSGGLASRSVIAFCFAAGMACFLIAVVNDVGIERFLAQ